MDDGASHNRALVVMATGLGKTVFAAALTARWLTERPSRVLFLAHTTDILRQARAEFQEALADRVTTGIITSDACERPDAGVLFCTFQSMAGRLDQTDARRFGLVIIDEAHHGHAMTYRTVIEHFAPEFLLGMTATPDRHDGQDIRSLFGEECYSFPLAEALADPNGWLCPVEYRVLSDNLSIPALRRLIKRLDAGRRVSRKAIDTTIFLQERLECIAQSVRDAQQGDKRTIVFCRSVAHLHQVHRFLVDAEPYHAGLSARILRDLYDAFRNRDLQTLLVVDKFNEGVDIPDAELLVFLRATDSNTVWLQQLGRGLRRAPDKERVVVLDFVANCDRILAVHDLGLEVTRHTGAALPEAMIVYGKHFGIVFSQELRDVVELLRRLDVPLYPTYEEARAAVTALGPPRSGIKVWYRETACANNPRLPKLPSQRYADDWRSLAEYCGRTKISLYPTYEEARAAVIAQTPPMRGRLQEWYRDIARANDPRLPANPDITYADDWRSLYEYCGHTKISLYPTYEEARAAVMAQEVPERGCLNTWYQNVARAKNPRLPSRPHKHYTDDWHGWPAFCGRT